MKTTNAVKQASESLTILWEMIPRNSALGIKAQNAIFDSVNAVKSGDAVAISNAMARLVCTLSRHRSSEDRNHAHDAEWALQLAIDELANCSG